MSLTTSLAKYVRISNGKIVDLGNHYTMKGIWTALTNEPFTEIVITTN